MAAREPGAPPRGNARRVAAAVWLLLGMLLACAGGTAGRRAAVRLPELQESAAPPAHVVLVSVAGLAPDRYRGRGVEPPAMPTLAALAAGGVSADAVRSVAPASRYPAHASLVSGRDPAHHGIVADRRIGDRGVSASGYGHASLLRAPTLWTLVSRANRGVASLSWPSTVGASIDRVLPDLDPTRRGETWLGVMRGSASPGLLAWAQEAGGNEAAAQIHGPARDAVLVEVACRIVEAPAPPTLLLLRLSQTQLALFLRGPASPEAASAFAHVDAEIARLVGCLKSAKILQRTALFVVGDHGTLAVHTLVSPNAVLADAGLLTPSPEGTELISWTALARANGGSAFVYARGDQDALLARRALEKAAERTRVFRVVSAQEMLRLGADPDAWFGLEAEPGFVFGDGATAPLLRPAAVRASGGYLPGLREMDAGFVAWGRGLRRGVRIPVMRQTDVAPTAARLLGLELAEADGRVLVGALAVSDVGATSVCRMTGMRTPRRRPRPQATKPASISRSPGR